MPLASIAHELRRAQAGCYAVPLFDVVDTHSTEGVLRALEDRCAPGIIGLYSGLLDQPYGHALAAYVRARAEGASVPVSLMLDHGQSVEHCTRAIACGCTDVMYDGSKLPFEENVAATATVVRAAHAQGLAVEAELGHVGAGSEYRSFGAQRLGFTDPDTVSRFVTKTGVDFLAVAIGTAHGVYDGEPALDLDLLRRIRDRTDVPLALHGGSGCTEEQYRGAIAAGIAKVNIATDLFAAAAAGVTTAAREGVPSYFVLTRAAVEAVEDRAGHYLDVFGASGRAGR
jgi:fructose-bisphosphate aldolase class II